MEAIQQHILHRFDVNAGSVYAALKNDSHDRFRILPDGRVALTAWETPTLLALASLVNTPQYDQTRPFQGTPASTQKRDRCHPGRSPPRTHFPGSRPRRRRLLQHRSQLARACAATRRHCRLPRVCTDSGRTTGPDHRALPCPDGIMTLHWRTRLYPGSYPSLVHQSVPSEDRTSAGSIRAVL